MNFIDKHFGLILVSSLVVATSAGIIAAIHDQDQWEEFASVHDCHVVGKVSGESTVATGVGSNGQVTITPIYIPGKTGYACNDGVTYWR